jgi:hypothetical protein
MLIREGFVEYAPRLQDTTAIRKDLDARANFANFVGCFEDLHIVSGE